MSLDTVQEGGTAAAQPPRAVAAADSDDDTQGWPSLMERLTGTLSYAICTAPEHPIPYLLDPFHPNPAPWADRKGFEYGDPGVYGPRRTVRA